MAGEIDFSRVRVLAMPLGFQTATYIGKFVGTSNPDNTTILIWTPRCLQKSYKKERRHVSPPPRVVTSCCEPPIEVVEVDGQQRREYTTPSFYVTSMCYRGDAKATNLRVCLRDVGSFVSPRIEVRSKPIPVGSRKCVVQRDTFVVLYNRIKTDSMSTKYLGTGDKKLTASEFGYEPFQIGCRDVTIRHGSVIVLTANGISTTPLKVVNKTDAEVCDTHRIALVVNGTHYLSSKNDVSTVPITESVPEECLWTICTMRLASYSLCCKYQASPQLSARFAPEIPIVTEIRPYNAEQLVLTGHHFHECLSVWFGTVQAPTVCVSHTLLRCLVPVRPAVPVHVLLVRSDGMIFPTGYAYSV